MNTFLIATSANANKQDSPLQLHQIRANDLLGCIRNLQKSQINQKLSTEEQRHLQSYVQDSDEDSAIEFLSEHGITVQGLNSIPELELDSSQTIAA